MAALAPVESQSAAGMSVDNMPDIAAEQAALAASVSKVAEGEAPPSRMREDGEVVAKPTKEVEKPYVAPVEPDVDEPFDFRAFAKETNRGDKGETAATAAVVKPAVVAAAPAKPTVEARDVSDVEEDLRPLLKQMSNEAFAKIKPIIAEQKKTKEQVVQLQTELAQAKKSGLPDNYYEHELGHVLSPEFSQLSQSSALADSVLNHWRTQLTAVRAGADTYVPLVQNSDGTIVQGQPQKVDRNTDVQLAEYHTWAQQQAMREQTALGSLAAVHKERYGQVKNWVAEFQQKAFPIFDKDPELKAMVPDTIKNLPVALQSNPLAPILAKAFISLAKLGEQLKAASAGKQ